ncbi:MAG: ABC transporter substrate-binding protein [Thermodesulfobacteriota bacterium]|nr:ABC transporter substrate-binding protein [Thermodesulfobacteriota bacterium]
MKITISFPLILFFLLISPDPGLSQEPLKVGVLIPFTGRWGDSGRECARGMLDAGKWINQQGGVFGKKLEIILADDTSQPAEFIAAFRKLNEADRILLLYIHSTETFLALQRHIHLNRIPALTGSFPSHLANASKHPYLFSIAPTPLDLSKIAMKFISERSDVKMRRPKVIFVGSPDHLGQHFLDDAKHYANTLGLEIGPDIWISGFSAAEKISSPLGPLKSFNPDFAYLSLTSKETFSFLQEARDVNLKNRWVCSMKAFDENLSAFDGVWGVQPISPFGEDVPGMAEIREAHQKWHPYDSHTLSYVEGWTTVKVIVEALGRALLEQGFSRERVKLSFESFRNFVVGGLLPPLTITVTDHRPSVESRIFIVKEGKLSRQTGFISIGRSEMGLPVFK